MWYRDADLIRSRLGEPALLCFGNASIARLDDRRDCRMESKRVLGAFRTVIVIVAASASYHLVNGTLFW